MLTFTEGFMPWFASTTILETLNFVSLTNNSNLAYFLINKPSFPANFFHIFFFISTFLPQLIKAGIMFCSFNLAISTNRE
jgi:hypothetical protein